MQNSNFKTMVFYWSLYFVLFYSVDLSVQLEQPTDNVLDLEAGDVCRKGEGLHADYVCTHVQNCTYLNDDTFKKNEGRDSVDIIDVCSYDIWEPIICCPPSSMNGNPILPRNETATSSYADKKCREYSEFVPTYGQTPSVQKRDSRHFDLLITGGTKVEPLEFPHMALLGYGHSVFDKQWGCGGSLISEIWILTAAHCANVPLIGSPRWARLGDLNVDSITDDAQPRDYRIVQHVLHPDYQSPIRYNDIALFRLESYVEFSQYVRPICLNSDPLINPTVQIATGWGQISTGGPQSSSLLKVELNVIPAKQCNNSYFASNNPKLKFGIIPDMMLCAGSFVDGKDTCMGDSGGPIQIKNFDYKHMYLQIGITSFGKFCGDKNSPGVYTKVSRYISWIESIVWPERSHT